MIRWIVLENEDPRGRDLVDGVSVGKEPHYSRQTPGAKGYLAPGQRFALYMTGELGVAIWGVVRNMDPVGNVRWRNTIFRNESRYLASDLAFDATLETYREWVARYGALPPERLRTEIDVRKTAARRSKHKPPGVCYAEAGWRFLGLHQRAKRAEVHAIYEA